MALSRPPSAAIVGVVSAAAIATALSALVVANSDPDLEGPATYVPVVVVVWLPAILGALGLRHPTVLLAAGTACFPLSLLSLAGATLPLLVPAVLYLFAYRSVVKRESGFPGLSAYIVAVLGLVLGISGMIPLVVGSDETVCSKTILFPDGRRETLRVAESQFGKLGSPRNGVREVASECHEVPPSWAGALSVGLVTTGVLLIAYLGKSPTGTYKPA